MMGMIFKHDGKRFGRMAVALPLVIVFGACGLIPGLGRVRVPGPVPAVGAGAVTRTVRAAASGDIQGALNAATGGVLGPDAEQLMRSVGPLAVMGVKAIGQAIERHVAEKRQRDAKLEEDRRLRLATTELFYATQCSSGGGGEGAKPKSADDPASLESQAAELFGQGEYVKAEPLLKRAHELREKKQGKEHPDTARTLNKLAVLQLAMNNYKSAIVYAAASLDIRDKLLKAQKTSNPPQPPEVAASLDVAESSSTMAAIFRAAGAYVDAKPGYERALQLREKYLESIHLCVAESKNGLGELYQVTGNYQAARPLFESALDIRTKKLGPEHRDVAESTNNLASLYKSIGVYNRAEELYQRALQSRLKLGEDHPDVAESLNDLGGLYRLTGDYVKAEQNYQRALDIRLKKLGENLEAAQSENALARLYELMGDYKRARPLYQAALAIRQKKLVEDHPDIAESLGDVAGIAVALEEYEQAEGLYQKALAIRQKKLGAEHPLVAESLGSLGSVHLARGDYRKAEAEYKQALEIRKKKLGGDHPDVAQSMHRLAVLYQTKGDHKRAEQLYRDSLSLRERKLGAEHPDVAESLVSIATLQAATGKAAQGVESLRRAFRISEHLLRSVGLASGEARMDALLRTLRVQEEIAYSLVLETPRPQAAAPLAMAMALLRKGRSVDEAAGASRAIYQGLSAADRQKFEDLKALRSQIAHLSLGGIDKDGAAEVKRLKDQADRLEEELLQKSAPLRAKGNLAGPDDVVGRVAKALGKDGALVEVVAFHRQRLRAKAQDPRRGDLRYLALVLGSDAKVQVADLGAGQPIDEGINALLKLVTQTKRDEKALEAAYPATLQAAGSLYQMLIRPVRPLVGAAKTLYLSLDSQLHLLPFAALHDGKRFLAESFQLTYLTSGRDLLRGAEGIQRSTTVALIAKPDFIQHAAGGPSPMPSDESRGMVEVVEPDEPKSASKIDSRKHVRGAFQLSSISPLAGTAEEAHAIQKMLPKAKLIEGSGATKQAFLDLEAPGILHVATHGYFRKSRGQSQNARGLILVGESAVVDEDPLLSSMLLLAGAGVPVEHGGSTVFAMQPDGLATALEVAGMNLWGTQLVVLSACESGLGDVHNLGQGVYGLRRAVMVAGAETLVTSLWKVDDAITRDMMSRYYQNLLAGQGRVEAMREASEHIRKKHKYPVFWAPFIVIGAGGPVEGIAGNKR